MDIYQSVKSYRDRPLWSLNPDEMETLRTQGYVGPFMAYAPDEISAIRQTVYDRVLPIPTPLSPYPTRLRHLDSKTTFELCASPPILERMKSLYGPDLILWSSSFFDKKSAGKEEYPWHVDAHHAGMVPTLSLSAWMALTPSTVENGCMEVIPGSHRKTIPPAHCEDSRFSFLFGGRHADSGFVNSDQKQCVPMDAGQFILFNDHLAHRSGVNKTNERRLGLSIRVTLPQVKIYESQSCILLSGSDPFAFNRMTKPPGGEPDESNWFLSPPDCEHCSFERPPTGMGWHSVESDGERSFCWTGPQRESWIDLSVVGKGERRLRCEIAQVIDQAVLGGLKVAVNGTLVPVEVKGTERGVQLDGRVSADILDSGEGRVRVTFWLPRVVRPCDVNPASNDVRPLGIALSSVSISRK